MWSRDGSRWDRGRRSPLGGLAVAAALTGAAAIVAGVPLPLAWLVTISLVAFAAYGWDKTSARRGAFRIPELTLHALSGFGGFVGAFAGQQFFRHKTRNVVFKIVYALSAALWAGLAWLYVGP